LVKNGGACVLSTMFSIHNISSILIEFQQQRFFLKMERAKNEELINLELNLHFGFPNHELSLKFIFLLRTNWFSFQNDAM
jgi:transcriptional accessory protein Tex/SPT6